MQDHTSSIFAGPVPQLLVVLATFLLLLVVFPPLNHELMKLLHSLKNLWRELEGLPKALEDAYVKNKEQDQKSSNSRMRPSLRIAQFNRLPKRLKAKKILLSEDDGFHTPQFDGEEERISSSKIDKEVQVNDIDFQVLELRRNPLRPDDYVSLRANPEYYRARTHVGLNINFNAPVMTSGDKNITNLYQLNPAFGDPVALNSIHGTLDPHEHALGSIPPPPPPQPPLSGEGLAKEHQSMLPTVCDEEVQTNTCGIDFDSHLVPSLSNNKIMKLEFSNNRENSTQPTPQLMDDIKTESLESLGNDNDNMNRFWSIEVESIEHAVCIQSRRALQTFFDQKLPRKSKIQLNLKETSQILTKRCLTTVPTQFLDASGIVHLELSDNYLTVLPNWFAEPFKNLTFLNLANNYLTELPEKFGDLKKLKELDLSNNQFEYLPHSLCNLYYLFFLDISGNALCAIHNDVAKLKQSILELNISSNNLVDLPVDFKNMKRMKILRYNDNNFLFFTLSETINLMSLDDTSKVVKSQARKRSNSLKLDEDSSCELSKSRTIILLLLLESERRYSRFLNILHEFYYLPLRTRLSDTCKEFDFTITEKQSSDLLPVEINEIVMFSRAFLLRLLERVALYESNPVQIEKVIVGDIYLELVQMFTQLYANYVHIYDKVIQMLKTLRVENSNFDRYLQSRQKVPICEGMELESLLVLPLSRIPRHVSLLRQLLKKTPVQHGDHRPLKQAVKLMEQSFEQQKENFFQLNNKYKIFEIQRKLKIKRLYQPNRFLIREGKLTLKATQEVESFKKMFQIDIKESVERMKNLTMNDVKGKLDELGFNNIWEMRLSELPVFVYLFSDIVIVKEIHILQKLIGKFNSYDLHGAEVRASEENETQFELMLENRKRTLVFVCETKQECMIWYNEFVKVLVELNQDSDTTSSIDLDFANDEQLDNPIDVASDNDSELSADDDVEEPNSATTIMLPQQQQQQLLLPQIQQTQTPVVVVAPRVVTPRTETKKN